jgi:chromosome segregation ATPase
MEMKNFQKSRDVAILVPRTDSGFSSPQQLQGSPMIATDQRLLQAFGLVCTLFILLVTSLAGASAQTQAAGAATDTFVTVVQRRALEEVKADLAWISAVRAGAQARKGRITEEIRALGGRITTLEKEIEALDGRLDTLDSDKDSAAYATAKDRKSLLKKLRDLLETRTDARKAEGEAAQSALGFAEAREAMCTQESALLAKRTERDAAAKKGGASASLAQLDKAIKDLETELNERREKALKTEDEWVSAEKDALDALRKLAEAQDTFHEE